MGYVEGVTSLYATGVFLFRTPQNQNRQAIQQNLHQAYTQDGGADRNWRGHFDIIGHSYGGINARFYLEVELSSGRSKLCSVWHSYRQFVYFRLPTWWGAHLLKKHILDRA